MALVIATAQCPVYASTTPLPGSCVDGGGVTWVTGVVWGDTYAASDGTQMVRIDEARWTTDATMMATDSSVKVYDGSGRLVQSLTKTATTQYSNGKIYDSPNLINVSSRPGTTKVIISLGKDGDGFTGCSLTYVEPSQVLSNSSREASPVGDLPGWKQTFREDFTRADVGLGSWPGVYGSDWDAYPEPWRDTSKKGVYSPARTLSVSDGVLDIFLHSEDGQPYVAAPQPRLNAAIDAGRGQRYGRFSLRFRADAVAGYKTAWLLWPDDGVWPDHGEIDFPEGDLDSTVAAFAHYARPQGGQGWFNTTSNYSSWHTAVTEWSPGRLTFILDGKVIGISTKSVPDVPMHWVLQTETKSEGNTPTWTAGHVQIDWVAAYQTKA